MRSSPVDSNHEFRILIGLEMSMLYDAASCKYRPTGRCYPLAWEASAHDQRLAERSTEDGETLGKLER